MAIKLVSDELKQEMANEQQTNFLQIIITMQRVYERGANLIYLHMLRFLVKNNEVLLLSCLRG